MKKQIYLLAAVLLTFSCLLPIFSFALPCWTASGAAIGNASVYIYPPIATTTITLTHTVTTESLSVTAFTGSPSGVHIYRVDAVPQIYSGTCASGSMVCTNGGPGIGCTNDRYFGVFAVGTTTYTATYNNYTANPFVIPANVLAGRNDNSVATWVNLAATISATTLTKTGESAGRGEYLLGYDVAAVPVELLYFTANLTIDKKGLCQWATATEINNNYFIVERTRDGVHYDFVGKVNGAGNSNSALYYSTLDADPYQGVSYYRLKQVDFDGSTTYSKLVSINLENLEIITIYPNPAIDNIDYLISSPQAGNVTITVVDVLGRIILKREEAIDAGLTKKQLNVASMSDGSYLLRITTQNMEKTQKQFVIK